ncbi:neuropeptide-like 1 isoform X2 [Sitodiplosis mosellana]|uniref:neuropeptide-like 1 isoform X2 n=1 Tax=Sitodiplosis mosellana TaxID=263140 RepID=UPI00244511DF|nr:neuropeptide-like 1 isoform X2 [Sitodiplosis mosellana]
MCGNPINLLLFIFTVTALYIGKVHAEYDLNGLSACEQEQIARQIFYPKSGNEMHANALRNQLKQIIENYLIANDGIQYVDDENQPTYDSIDLDALEKHAAAILNEKRNVAAMARLGLMREAAKRSLATLAKNGQLPPRENDDNGDVSSGPWNNDKRNIGSIARGGSITGGKRNVGALARDFLLPPNGKRNLPSILRSGGGSSTSSTNGPQQPKRNVGTLARDNLLPYYHQSKNEKRDVTAANNKHSMEEKRNIGSVKNAHSSSKVKRDTTYDDFPDESEIDTQTYQAAPFNYNDLNELYAYYGMPDISNEKRFLGSIVDDGWSPSYRAPSAEKRNIGSLARQGLLRSDVSNYLNQKQYRQQSKKRHLGALARSGWLPAFRSIRGGRFSRSGRGRAREDFTADLINKSDQSSRAFVNDVDSNNQSFQAR